MALVLGPFELIRPLARGGMGEVWEGTHGQTGERVAIKLLHKAGPELAEALEREVRAVARLDHPHLVWIHDQGRVPAALAPALSVVPDSPWLAMEFCGAGTLKNHAGADWGEQRRWLLQLLDALAHAHARGVLHRDIKPANILFREVPGQGPVLKLADFGLAHRFDAAGAPDRGGTLSWMAPEQFLVDGEQGPWTDLYAVGVVAWWLASGGHPYRAQGVDGWLAAHSLGRPAVFAPRMPVPDGLWDWLARATQIEPTARFRRAADAAAALEALGPPVGTARPAAARPVPGGAPRVPPHWAPDVQWPRTAHLLGAGLRLFGLRTPPLVGRAAACDALWAEARAVDQTRTPRVVVIEGASGHGKSRLSAWLLERLHEVGSATGFLATHGPMGGPMDGLPGLVARSLRADPRDPEAVASRAAVWLAEPALRDAVCAVVAGDARPSRFRTVANFCSARAEGRIPALWLDDAQWGLEAIQLAAWIAESGEPLLVVLTVQSEALAERDAEADALTALLRLPGVTQLGLAALTPRHRAELLHGLLHLDPGLSAEIDARASGNPAFAVQWVASLVEQEHLEPGPQGYRARRDLDRVPTSIADVWRHRLEPLLADRADWRRALEVAAVLGMDIDAAEWAEACQRAGTTPPRGLVATLAAARFVEIEPGSAGGRWRFAHAMVREAVLADAEVGPLHRAVAEMLAAASGAPERVGVHRFAAGEFESSLTPLRTAAGNAMRAGKMWQSIGLWDHVIAALWALERGDSAEAWGVRLDRVAPLRYAGRIAECLSELEALFAWCTAHGNLTLHARGLDTLANTRFVTGELAEAGAAASEGLRVATLAGDRRMAASLRNRLASIAGRLGDFEACELHARAVLAADPDEEPMLGATARFTLAVMLQQSGKYDEAGLHARAGLAAAKRGRHPMLAADFERLLADIELSLDHFDQAEAHLAACLLAYEASESSLLTIAVNLAGWLAIRRGRLDEAERAFRRSLALAEAAKRAPWISRSVIGLMFLTARRRDWVAFDRLDERFRARSDREWIDAVPYVYAEASIEAHEDGKVALARRLLAEAEAAQAGQPESTPDVVTAMQRARALVDLSGGPQPTAPR